MTKSIGLALGGGGALGAAHVGVLKALEEHGVTVSCISGTSIGAYVAALHAFGVSLERMREAMDGLSWLEISSLSISKVKLGLLTNDKLGDSIEKILGPVRIEEAELPLAIVATDIGACQKAVLTEGPVAMAVMASSCLPAIFSPVEIDGQLYVDGGLVDNVPVSPLRDLGAETVIAVDLAARRSTSKPEDLFDVLINSIDTAIDSSTRLRTENADLVVAPRLSDFSRTALKQPDALIEAGFEACSEALKMTNLVST